MNTNRRGINKSAVPLFVYLGSMIFGVLFFGAIHAWVYTIVFLGVIAASLMVLRRDVGPRESSPFGPSFLRWVKTDMSPLFFFFLVFLILQMIPLPPWLVALISPEAKLVGDMSRPAAAMADPAGLSEKWYTLAPYVYPVRMSLVRWIVYGLFFFGMVRCLDSRSRIETAIVALLCLCVLDALYGIMQTYSGSPHIWWFKPSNVGFSSRSVSGTYLNHNHFAGLMEMGIALAVGYAAALAGSGERRREPSHRARSFRRRFLRFFSGGKSDIQRFLVLFAGGVIGLGVILSASRGGIIATAGALLLMGLFFHVRKDERRKGRVILILCGIALIYGVHAGMDYTVGRFELFDRDMENRWIWTEKTIDLFKDYLAAGVGIGNFRHAYGKYQDPVHKLLYIDYAHNDYAQFLAEAGVVGFVLLLAGIGWYVVRTFRLWRRRNDSFSVCLGIVPFGAIFAMAIHSVSDYNLHRPANMLVLIAVIAIGYAALYQEGGQRTRIKYPRRLIPMKWRGAAFTACAVGLILWSGVWTIRNFIAETHCSTEINTTLNLDQNPAAREARAAIDWNPGNAMNHQKLAQALIAERNRRMAGPSPDAEGWKRSHGPIIAALEHSIELNPMNAQTHVLLGWEYSYLYDRPDHFTRWLPAADVSMERAVWFAGDWPQYPRLQYDIGNYWAMRSKSFGPDDPNGKMDWDRAVWHYRKGMELEGKKDIPEKVKDYIRTFYTDESRLKQLR